MSSKAYDISLIKKYLHGELDTRSMYRFERTAQDDPFLMDALDGYYILSDQQANIEELKGRLHGRIQNSKRKIILLWPLIGAVIAVLAFAVIGVWLFAVYLPNLKKEHKAIQPIEKATYVNPDPIQPDSQSITALSTTTSDTTKKDTSAKKNQAILKADSAAKQVKHDPTRGSVEASTVIADLNRAPYSTAKPKVLKNQQNTNATGEVKTGQANSVHTPGTVVINPLKTNVPTGNAGSNSAKPVNMAGGTPNNSGNSANKTTVDKTANTVTPIKSVATGNTDLKNSNAANVKPVIVPAPQKKDVITVRETGTPLNVAPGKGSTFQVTKLAPGPSIKKTDITSVSGIVVSADNGKPLSGVALRIMGTQLGTVTDANGRFSIHMDHNQVLQANFLGYYGKQIAAAPGDIKVLLQPVKDTKPESMNSVIETSPVKKEQDNAFDKKKVTPVTENKTTATVAQENKLAETPREKKSADNTTDKKNPENITQNAKVSGDVLTKVNLGKTIQVTGRVTALSTRNPLSQVVMWNKTAEEQYRLQGEGSFNITVHQGDEIYVGRPGFKTQLVKIKKNTHLDIILEENNPSLHENFVKSLVFEPYDDASHPNGGWNKFKAAQNIKSTDGKTGTVKVDFTVNADNSVSGIKVSKSVGALADTQAVKVIREQTKWMHNADNKPEKLSVKFKVE